MYDAIIIGGGMGGIICAAVLAKEGKKIVILEKNNKLGGYCSDFIREGFTFIYAMDWLTGFGEKGRGNSILLNLGIDVQNHFKKFDTFRIIKTDDKEIIFSSDAESLKSQLIHYFPKEEENIKNFIDELISFNSPRFQQILYKYRNDTFEMMVNRFFSDEQIKIILNAGIPYNYAAIPIIFMFATCFAKEIYFFKDITPTGFCKIITDRISELGGEIHLNKKVDKIIVDEKKVVCTNGEEFNGKVIISDIDITSTYHKLIGKDKIPQEFLSQLSKRRVSPSVFSVFLGLKTDEILRDVEASQIIYVPSHYIEANRENDPLKWDIKIEPRSKILPLLSPMGKCCIDLRVIFYPNQIKTFFELMDDVNYSTNEKYNSEKEKMSDILISNAEKIFPGLKNQIIYRTSASPLTYQKYSGNLFGSPMGWEMEGLEYSLGLKLKLPFQGVYQVGHWANPPSIEGMIISSAIVSKNVLSYLKKNS